MSDPQESVTSQAQLTPLEAAQISSLQNESLIRISILREEFRLKTLRDDALHQRQLSIMTQEMEHRKIITSDESNQRALLMSSASSEQKLRDEEIYQTTLKCLNTKLAFENGLKEEEAGACIERWNEEATQISDFYQEKSEKTFEYLMKEHEQKMAMLKDSHLKESERLDGLVFLNENLVDKRFKVEINFHDSSKDGYGGEAGNSASESENEADHGKKRKRGGDRDNISGRTPGLEEHQNISASIMLGLIPTTNSIPQAEVHGQEI